MLRIPHRYGHFVFGIIQSGLTSCIAAGIASFPFINDGQFFMQWMSSWLISWLIMLPVVIFAAPFIRKAVMKLTDEIN